MRIDSLGLFWEDKPPPPKQAKIKEKRQPPEPVWLSSDYLPGIEEAKAFNVTLMEDVELLTVAKDRIPLVFDIETYPNYFLASFKSVETKNIIYFEMYEGHQPDFVKFKWILENCLTVGFNSLKYDLIISYLALDGKPLTILKRATEQIIVEEFNGSDVLRQYKVKKFTVDHIDLIEVAPLQASLKIYGGRLHVPQMQDLPFPPNTVLSEDQKLCVRWYNINSDLVVTDYLYQSLKEQIKLRETMSQQAGIDLRSKSDAQVAEAIITKELTSIMGFRPRRPVVEIGTSYYYNVPQFIKYSSPLLKWVLDVVRNARFLVDESGSVGMPSQIKELKIDINGNIYQMGIGGLHSCESSISHSASENEILKDVDVVSYYPNIILNQQLYPEHLGIPFLHVYDKIVRTRIAAKQAGDKVVADSLKITINGSFGKLGSKYSILYSPNLLIQVTVSGQLSLLMLIERLELAGIRVVSANTDGVVIKCPRVKETVMNHVIKQWEIDTGFETEDVLYKKLFSRDVNNYLALKEDGSFKLKGIFSNPWGSKKPTSERLSKNPSNSICIEALQAYLLDNTPIMTTLHQCRDITKFLTVRTVAGGAAKVWHDGKVDYLGKSIRWYYAQGVEGDIVYVKNGNRVPRSIGAKPLMTIPKEFPHDIDLMWYNNECLELLKGVNYEA